MRPSFRIQKLSQGITGLQLFVIEKFVGVAHNSTILIRM